VVDPVYPGIRTIQWKIFLLITYKKSSLIAKVILLNLKILSLTAYDDDNDDNNNNSFRNHSENT
jgi:hypothetical protein